MLILGIETSCDETSVAVVKDKTQVLSNIVCSQVDFHAIFGGVVPEIASRKHLEFINVALKQAMQEANVTWDDLDAIAVTNGPGLVGSLVVGVSVAKAICLARKLPLIAVNHLEGHLFSCFLPTSQFPSFPASQFPYLCLIASGGHSDLVLVKDVADYDVLGRTRDDAAGEAFDKVARALGLGFPGGPAIDKAARQGNPDSIRFPRADLGETLDFSFSGLKTAVVRYLKGFERPVTSDQRAGTHHASLITTEDIAASFQEAVVDMLVSNTVKAALETGVQTVGIAGGVAANSRLRAKMTEAAKEHGFKLVIPKPIFCTDNAAMIACAGSFRFERALTDGLDVDVHPVLELTTAARN